MTLVVKKSVLVERVGSLEDEFYFSIVIVRKLYYFILRLSC